MSPAVEAMSRAAPAGLTIDRVRLMGSKSRACDAKRGTESRSRARSTRRDSRSAQSGARSRRSCVVTRQGAGVRCAAGPMKSDVPRVSPGVVSTRVGAARASIEARSKRVRPARDRIEGGRESGEAIPDRVEASHVQPGVSPDRCGATRVRIRVAPMCRRAVCGAVGAKLVRERARHGRFEARACRPEPLPIRKSTVPDQIGAVRVAAVPTSIAPWPRRVRVDMSPFTRQPSRVERIPGPGHVAAAPGSAYPPAILADLRPGGVWESAICSHSRGSVEGKATSCSTSPPG